MNGLVDGKPEFFVVFWTDAAGRARMTEAATASSAIQARDDLEKKQASGDGNTRIRINDAYVTCAIDNPPKRGTPIRIARFRGEWL